MLKSASETHQLKKTRPPKLTKSIGEREKEWLVGISQHGNISKAYYDKQLEKRIEKQEIM